MPEAAYIAPVSPYLPGHTCLLDVPYHHQGIFKGIIDFFPARIVNRIDLFLFQGPVFHFFLNHVRHVVRLPASARTSKKRIGLGVVSEVLCLAIKN